MLCTPSAGDEIVVVVKRARPNPLNGPGASASSSAPKVRRGDVRRAVVVRTKYPTRRPDGRYVRFDDNAAVLVNNKKEMIGNRIGGVVAAELRSRGWGKIVSLGESALALLSCMVAPLGTTGRGLGSLRLRDGALTRSFSCSQRPRSSEQVESACSRSEEGTHEGALCLYHHLQLRLLFSFSSGESLYLSLSPMTDMLSLESPEKG